MNELLTIHIYIYVHMCMCFYKNNNILVIISKLHILCTLHYIT